MVENIVLLLAAYCIGSIPFGVVVVHFFGKGDLQKLGSGNIGATNVVRTQGKWLGGLVFFLDASKGVLLCAIAAMLGVGDCLLAWVGFCAVLGHCFSCFLRFQGGKGVATSLGIFLFLTPPIGFLSAVLWVCLFYFSRISSLSSLVSFACAPILVWFLPEYSAYAMAYSGIFLVVIIRHYGNIMRLIQGTEPTFKGNARKS
ncbi:MAG: glycerol-3-phosphate 1-O-acyltransferase PlsY [Holosporales bacterium]|jgi:glycerol-3-phosphate acyltransferase PlsY|nr:glycerol-3-phosphate 1-O-acyltransferase PlsY [Holosporales bacterium]